MGARRERSIQVAAGQIQARLMNEASETLGSIHGLIAEAGLKRCDLLVLPECAYPAYLLGSAESYRRADHLTGQDYIAWLGERAAEHQLHIISGFVEDDGDRLFNSVVIIDAGGHEVGRTRKRFMWHVDQQWFSPGNAICCFQTDLGRIGIVICAELRVPEITASLIADGAELIAMPTCWINSARQPGEYYNPLEAFMVEARTREFHIPFICADKSGLEMTTGYVGRSCIVDAEGKVLAKAAATGESLVSDTIQIGRPARQGISDSRRRSLLAPESISRPEDSGPRPLKLAAIPTSQLEQRMSGPLGENLFKPLQQQGVTLVVANAAHEALAEKMSQFSRAFDIQSVCYPEPVEVQKIGPARIGCVSGRASRHFASARALALEGVELLAMFDAPADLPLLRTRALENRTFVAAVGASFAAIIDPDGQVIAQTTDDPVKEVIAEIDLARSADKCVAPKTDIFKERRVNLFRF